MRKEEESLRKGTNKKEQKKNIEFFKQVAVFFVKNPVRLIILAFTVIILFGTLLIASPVSNSDNQWLNFWDALFTTTSAVCVTGLSCFDVGVQFSSFGQLVLMCLIQIGGLGFMTAATFIFVMLGKKVTLQQRLVIKESFDTMQVQGTVKLINNIIIYTLTVEFIASLIMMGYFIPNYGFQKGIFYSLFHSVSSFCNAGFDILNTKETAMMSLELFANVPLIILPIGINIFLGGMGFSVILDVTRKVKSGQNLRAHSKVVILVSVLLIFLTSILYIIFEYDNAYKGTKFYQKVLYSLFQATSSRTGGFSIVNQNTYTAQSQVLTMLNMFIGASPASTGGGIKTTTFLVLLTMAGGSLIGKKEVNIYKERITEHLLRKAVAIFVFAAISIVCGLLLILSIENKNINNGTMRVHSIMFEVISAFSTTGYTLGLTPILSRASRFILGLLMFIGKIGTMTIGAAMVLKMNNKVKVKIQYPDSKIRIG